MRGAAHALQYDRAGRREGLYLTAGLAIAFVLFFGLGPIAMMGSAAFLLVYAAVNVAHISGYFTTAHRRSSCCWRSPLDTFGLLSIYVVQRGTLAPLVALVGLLVLSYVAEWVCRHRTGRTLQPQTVNGTAR